MIQRHNQILKQILSDINIRSDEFSLISNKLILHGPKKMEYAVKIVSHPRYSEAQIRLLEDTTFQMI